MESDENKPVLNLVVDSSVLIRRAPLMNLTDKVYAVEGLLSEIKDSNTKASLQVLPFEFKFKEPSSEAVKFIIDFSKKTGDYSNLSAVDLQLLALSYQLCKETLDEIEFKQLRLEPVKNSSTTTPLDQKQLNLDKKVHIAGFYIPKQVSSTSDDKQQIEKSLNSVSISSQDEHENEQETKEKQKHECIDKDADENHNDVTAEDDDDNEGWINPSNLKEMKSQSRIGDDFESVGATKLKVACMTSDFSMQNVLIQIGIPVLSIDGLIIKKARSYVFKCITCKKITTNMEKQFCPFCGYKTLERILMTIDSNGNKIYKERKKPLNTKGLRFSLPTPHGGKHPTYPILSEDQPRAQNFPSKKTVVQNNPLDPDYVYQASPFATRDVQSRASRLGIRSDSNRFNKR